MAGSGAVIVMDDRTCMVQIALRTAEFFHHESCGKCTPCREGAPWVVDTLRRIEEGIAHPDEVDLLLQLCDNVEGKCLCPLGDSLAMSVRAIVKMFREEFDEHVRQGGCTCPESRLRSLYPTPEAPASAGGDGVSTTEVETVTLEVDGREVVVPKGTPLVLAAAANGVEIPIFCYEPRLGPAVGACRMCMVEVEGMPKLQAACTMTATDGMKVHTQERARRGRPEGRARVPADQPPARLPGLRQGRRVPAAGPDVPLRARQHALPAAQAHVREAGADLAADRARPRALHPLLPLHALLGRRRRGRAADRARARLALDHRDVRGAPVREPVQRQRDRALPGRRADDDGLPLQGAAVGDRQRPDGLRPLPDRLQHLGDGARGPGPPRALARPAPTSTRAGSATRAASPSSTCAPTTATPRRSCAGDRGLDEATLGGTRPRPSRARLRHYANLYGPDVDRGRRLRRAVERGGLRLARGRRGRGRRRPRRQRPPVGAARPLPRDDRRPRRGRRDRGRRRPRAARSRRRDRAAHPQGGRGAARS